MIIRIVDGVTINNLDCFNAFDPFCVVCEDTLTDCPVNCADPSVSVNLDDHDTRFCDVDKCPLCLSSLLT